MQMSRRQAITGSSGLCGMPGALIRLTDIPRNEINAINARTYVMTPPLWLLFLSPFLWLARLGILLVFAVPGVPLVLVLAVFRVYRPRFSPQFGRDVMQFPWPFYPYCNFEDGVDGLRGGDPAQQWWADRTIGQSDARRIFVWSAFRNPVDSLRWVPLINPRIDPARVRYVGLDREPQDGESGWYFAWQGLYSCIRWEFEVRGRFYRFWLG
jgi:hypothetical protein